MRTVNKLLFIATAISLCLFHTTATAQSNSLSAKINEIIKDKKATVGTAICTIGGNDTLSVNGAAHLPMLSVFKFHIALAVLDQVDKGALTLSQKIKLTTADLLPDTWSPIRGKYANGDSLSVAKLIEYTVAQSDNNGCDILLRLIGGTEAVERYLQRIGVNEVAIKANEQQMHAAWDVQYHNWTTPLSAVRLLSKFYAGDAVSVESCRFLYNVMANTTTGAKRLKGLLAAGTVVAHKTGSSDTNSQGLTAAVNDIGIITLPNGAVYAIAVLVSDSAEDNTINEAIIAEISQAVWQYYASKL